MIIPDPGWFAGYEGGTGTTHGNWNPYDTHIPLIFMGWGIKHGTSNRTINMSDISPTLAALAAYSNAQWKCGQRHSGNFRSKKLARIILSAKNHKNQTTFK